MIKCLIVDDDDISRMEVEHMVKEIPFLNLIGTASSAIDAFSYILTAEPDLIFLDVVMPDITGLELLECISKRKIKVIIMTSERKYATDAYFNSDVAGFLSKPISKDSFLKTVAKVHKSHNVAETKPLNGDQIFIKVNSQLVKIITGDILYIESKGDHSFIHTTTVVYEVHSLLKSLGEKLQGRNFMRVHNSYIVNMDRISGIDGTFLLVNKSVVPVSQVNIKNVMSKLNILNRNTEYVTN